VGIVKRGRANNLSFIEPMKALPVRDLPVGEWLYEMKFDGYRVLAFKSGKDVRLVSRNQTDFGNDYPRLIDSLKLLTAENVVIDGESIRIVRNRGASVFDDDRQYPRRLGPPRLRARLTDPGSTATRDFSAPAPSMAANMIVD
jgi:ATP-dependent DNA ligase